MTRMLALLQVMVVILIVAYTTVHLFLGNFEQALAPFPILLLYYVLVIAHRKRNRY